MIELIKEYYDCWTRGDREAAASFLHDDFCYFGELGPFYSAESFMDGIWKYSEAITGVRIVRSAVTGDSAFVVPEWTLDDGQKFGEVSYYEALDGKLSKLVVIRSGLDVVSLFEPK